MSRCPVCGEGKARRQCPRQTRVKICSRCCASIRDPDCGDCAHYTAARDHQAARGRRRAAPSEGDWLIEINPEVADAVDGAMALAEQGKTREAEQILTALLREHPRNHIVCFGIGVLHVKRGKLRQAIEWFDRAIRIFPCMIEAHYNKGVAHQQLLDLPNCVRAFRKVVELGHHGEPETQNAQSVLRKMEAGIRREEGIGLDTFLAANDVFQRAVDCMERGEWRQALDGFRQAAAIHERNPPTHGNLGLCYAQLGRKAEALAELNRALELDPAYKPARSNRKVVERMTEGRPLENAPLMVINAAEGRSRE